MGCSMAAASTSKGVAGTQEGSIIWISSAVPLAASIMYRSPRRPQTFTISWGSAMMVVPP